MFPFMIRIHLQTLFFTILFTLAYGQDRVISSSLNPDCDTCSPSSTLVYIKAVGSNDTLHQIWDFTRGMPTVIYAVANRNSSMRVKWEGDVPVSFSLSGKLLYSFAASIDSLYEYDDCLDRGHIDERCPQRRISLRGASWRRRDNTLSDREAALSMRGHCGEDLWSDFVDIKLDLLPFKDYAVELPHLIHTANSTLIDVSIVNFTTSYNSSRFAIHFVMVSTDRSDDSIVYTMRKSLDDEHTPGMFEIMEIQTPQSQWAQAGGFLQFRPVGYTEPQRSVSSSTNAYISNFNRTSIPKRSTLGMFYRNFNTDNLLVQNMFISFGLPGDGYYRQHNYTSWSFTYGYGSPPVESVSLFVIIIIAIGLGVPLVLALSGITFVLVRRYKQRNPPARFTDDD